MTANLSGNRIYNEYIELAVGNTARFTVGTTGGNPDISTDDYKKLLYGHSNPSTSYTTIRINGANYIYGSGTFTMQPTFDAEKNNNISEQKIGNLRVKQVLSLINNTATKRDDVVEIKYIIKNEGSIPAQTGVRIMLDTMLGDNDSAPFRIPGTGSVTYEREYSGDQLPQYWQAFDSLSNPKVVSQGTLLRSSANKPDKVQFTNWGRVWDTSWGYKVNPSSQNGDSAVSVIWEPKNIEPNQEIEYVTYYGLSELVQDLRPPLAVSLFGDASVKSTQNGYEPNPFVVTVYVQNTGSGPASNVNARINLPNGLKLAANETAIKNLGSLSVSQEKQLSWSIEVESTASNRTLEYSVDVWADNTESKNVKKTIQIPAALETEAKDIILVHGFMGAQFYVDHSIDNSPKYSAINAAGIKIFENKEDRYMVWLPETSSVISELGLGILKFTSPLHWVLESYLGHCFDMLSCNDDGSPKYSSVKYQKSNPAEFEHDNVAEYPDQWIELKRSLNNYISSKNNELSLNDEKAYKLHTFSWDWRLDGDISVNRLDKYIEYVLQNRRNQGVNNPKVTIISYSMGGIITSKYISKGNEKKIDKFISIGTPYLGAPKLLYGAETGNIMNDYSFNLKNLIADTAMDNYVKQIAGNFRFNYQCLPQKRYFEKYPLLSNTYRGFVYEKVYGKFFGFDNYYFDRYHQQYEYSIEFLRTLDWTKHINTKEMVEKGTDPFSQSERFHDFDMLGAIKSVDYHVIVGTGHPTVEKIWFKSYVDNNNKTYKTKYAAVDLSYLGDGTTLACSGNYGQYFDAKRVYYLVNKTVGHGGLCNNEDVINQVLNILNTKKGNDVKLASSNISHQLPTNFKYLNFAAECPVELHVYDGEKHLGPNEDGNMEYDIERSDYFFFDDTKSAYVPDGNYQIKLVGLDEGTMDFTAKLIEETLTSKDVLKNIRFLNVPIKKGMVLTLDYEKDNDSIMLIIDENNDGEIDSTLKPSVILVGDANKDTEAPELVCNLSGIEGNNGWYISDVTVNYEARDDSSGINRINYSLDGETQMLYNGPVLIGQEGKNTIAAMASDNNWNTSSISVNEIMIDKSLPIIECNIQNGYQYLLNEDVYINWSVSDSISGVDTLSASLYNGCKIDTSSLGQKVITIIAKDKAGNCVEQIIRYNVVYNYDGLMSPLNKKDNVFNRNQTIPVKFKLLDSNGQYIKTGNCELYLQKNDSSGNLIEIPAIASGNSNNGNKFRYDSKENQYIYNLSVKDFTPGIWKLKIVLDDGTCHYYDITIK